MKLKMILCLLILSTVIFSVKNVDYYNGKFSIVAENYVLQLPQSLAEKAVLNQDFLISLVPSIKVNEEVLTISPSITSELISTPKNSFSFQVASEKKQVKIEEKIRIEEKQIISEIMIKNNREENAVVSVYYSVNAKHEKTIFIPDLYSEKSENYFVFTNPDFGGNALGVTFSMEMNLENQKAFLVNSSSYGILSKEFILKKGQSIQIKTIYYPFNLQIKKQSVFPLKEASHLENIYIDTNGETLPPGTTVSDKINQMLETTDPLTKSENGEFFVIHSVDLNNPKDSLDFAMYFKKMGEKNNVPTKLVIGKKDNFYYAWVQAYFGKWVDVDVFKGVKEQPNGYSLVYLEPTLEMHYLRNSSNIEGKDIYESTQWLKSTQENKFVMYLIILIIGGILIGVFVTLKATSLTKRFKFDSIEKQDFGGLYKITKKEKISDEFINDIFKDMILKGGEVDLNKMADEFHYSKDLISFAVAYLIDNGFITKETADKQTVKNIPIKEENIKDKFVNQKQKIGIIGVIFIAIILILLLFIV